MKRAEVEKFIAATQSSGNDMVLLPAALGEHPMGREIYQVSKVVLASHIGA